MTRQSIPLNEITILPSRMRSDMGDLDGLAESIRLRGLIQPVVLTQSKVLVAGERRYRAHKLLGLEHIDFVYVSDQFTQEITEDQQAELEFDENFWRKNFTWQEECLGILNIYRKKKRAAALSGVEENYTRTLSVMFGASVGTMHYILIVAKELDREVRDGVPDDKRIYWKFSSCSEAYRNGILAKREEELNRALAQKQVVQPTDAIEEFFAEGVDPQGDIVVNQQVQQVSLDAEKERYESNPLNTVPFEEYWAEKQKLLAEASKPAERISLSGTIINCDCIKFMNDSRNANRFDHIITDPPYAIDMDMLSQDNVGMLKTGIDFVRGAHDVSENIDLLNAFWPAAFKCTKDNAFVITFCDSMMFSVMHALAESAGFAVQRWPIIWEKVNQSSSNSAAGYNTTKDYEIILVARKPGATLFEKRPTSIIRGSNMEAKKITGHPFAKPFEVTRDLVSMVAPKGSLILEPFAGGGSIVLEMLKMEMRVVALEKDEPGYNKLLETVKREHYLRLNPNLQFI